jgi:hypothetical protein
MDLMDRILNFSLCRVPPILMPLKEGADPLYPDPTDVNGAADTMGAKTVTLHKQVSILRRVFYSQAILA